jgi:hypothetical protein
MVFSEHSQKGDMAYDIPPPEKLPEPGYYYHFKHDPDGPLNNYAYYIYGVGHHTENDCRPEDVGFYTSVSMTLAFYDVPAGATGMAR